VSPCSCRRSNAITRIESFLSISKPATLGENSQPPRRKLVRSFPQATDGSLLLRDAMAFAPKDMLAGISRRIRRGGSGIGGSERTAEESPPAGRVTDEPDYCQLSDNTGVAISVDRYLALANLALLHRRKIRRSHVRHVHLVHQFFGLLGFHHLLKRRVGEHGVPVLFRFLPAGMLQDIDECVV
jgi:hypothetical protein